MLANNIAGSSATATVSNSFTPATVPGAPASVSAVAGNASGTLTIGAPVSNGGSAITGYTATCTSAGNATGSATGASPLTVGALTNGVLYTCSVLANNSVGSSATATVSNSFTPAATVPNPPTLSFVVSDSGSLSMTFLQAPNNGGSPVINYTATCTTALNVATSVTLATSPIVITGLTNGTPYDCKVVSNNSVGPSANSNIINATPNIKVVDMVMTAVSTATTSVQVTGTFNIDNTEQNVGSSAMSVSSHNVKFYLSVDATIDNTDILIGQRVVSSALPAGGVSVATSSVTVPRTVAPGTYYVGAYADGSNQQPETNETNNSMAATTGTILVLRDVDLVMNTLTTASTSVGAGHSFSVDSTEKNRGTTDMTVNSNTIKFYLSGDSIITTGDIALTGSESVAGLAAGFSSANATTSLTVPRTVQPGTYYVGACADATNAQIETDETNNCMATAGTIVIVRDVDLRMSAVSTVATNVGAGNTFTIDSTEVNAGSTNMTASSNTIKFYLSGDNIITTSDRQLTGSEPVSALAAGTPSGLLSTVVIVPAATAPGTYYVGACADATNVQIETDETNNCTATAGTITVVRAVDLIMSAVSTAATSVGAGHPFTINSTEQNVGTTDMSSRSNTVKFYLSTVTPITTSDIALAGSESVSALAGGAPSDPLSTVVTVPKRVAPGFYYVGACADANRVQPEIDDANNCATATGTIEVTRFVDLKMKSVSTTATTVSVGADFLIIIARTSDAPLTALRPRRRRCRGFSRWLSRRTARGADACGERLT